MKHKKGTIPVVLVVGNKPARHGYMNYLTPEAIAEKLFGHKPLLDFEIPAKEKNA